VDQGKAKVMFFYQNPSITAIQFALTGVLLAKWLALVKHRLLKQLIVLHLVAALFAIMLLQSRTAGLALATGLLFVGYPYLRKWYSKQKIVFVAAALLAFAIFLMSVFVKTQSSAGRVFIWQNCFRLLQKNWLCGVGWGKFNPAYNHEQALYFANHPITDGIALRADDGYYAFNEWLHIWIETGILGFLFFLVLTILAVKISIKNIYKKEKWYGALLIPLITACLFSYPLHNWLLLTTGILFTGICLIDHFVAFETRKKFRNRFIMCFIIVAASLLSIWFYLQYQFSNARELAEEGRTNEAYGLSTKYKFALNRDYRFTTFYLDLLYTMGRVDETILNFNTFHHYHCNQILHSTVAGAYNETNDSLQAEKHFLTALYIAPYRLQSRQDLFNFYFKRGDTVKAKYWAQQIIDCPMKIITSKGIILKEQAEKFINSSPPSQTPSIP